MGLKLSENEFISAMFCEKVGLNGFAKSIDSRHPAHADVGRYFSQTKYVFYMSRYKCTS